MKFFKIIDTWISIGLIISFTILIIYEGKGFSISNNLLFTSYFVIGGWQVISMIVHAVKGFFTDKYGARYMYHWITFISVATMPAGSFWILFFTAPFMAIFYTGLCFNEVRKMNQRPLALLK
ncbi:MAG: hypothetical protein ABIO79_13205 [Ferruginibacter sp.]